MHAKSKGLMNPGILMPSARRRWGARSSQNFFSRMHGMSTLHSSPSICFGLKMRGACVSPFAHTYPSLPLSSAFGNEGILLHVSTPQLHNSHP
ncbi:hypothetical protein EMPG_14149 [Blastomyces silverae]|uniref:Uncharacterized protein n=1 Tax=Blastomyces silverae TaxID=2060906 RepID=A0A0H1BMT0_9EURO|nr:hypothetical protein EMPG_14149 [Blastomyces silverae]